MSYLIEAWEKHLAPLLNQCWNSLVFWRTLSLIVISLIIIIIIYRNKLIGLFKKDEKQNHDKEIFHKANQLMNELDITDFIHNLQAGDSYIKSEIIKINSFIDYFYQESNQFLKKSLKESSEKIIIALENLSTYCALNCFHFGSSNNLCLYPDHCVDRGGNGSSEQDKFYFEKQRELHNFASIAFVEYQSFRKKIKKILYL